MFYLKQVNELSQPSSIEVEEIVQQLVQSVLQRFFNDEAPSSYIGDSLTAKRENSLDLDSETCHTVGTSRDYLAKLLFWYTCISTQMFKHLAFLNISASPILTVHCLVAFAC